MKTNEPSFLIVLLDHGYPSVACERQVIENAGGRALDFPIVTGPEALNACEEADGIIVRWYDMNAEVIRRLTRCRVIVRYGVGFDNVDVRAATEAGIIVGHVPHYCLDEVSTHAVALLLACVRQVVRAHQKLQQGAWDQNPVYPIWRMAGRTLGIVGFGHIGRAVARKLQGWGMTLLVADPYIDSEVCRESEVEHVTLEELCRRSDYISLHVPLLPETRHLIGPQEFSWMKPGAVLVNTARGPVIDPDALVQALRSDHIAAAGLDVFEPEPLPLDSPLRQDPRVVITDHIAWYSEDSQLELKRTAAAEAAAVCRGGLPQSIANPEVLHRLGRADEWPVTEMARWQRRRLEKLGQVMV